MAYRVVFIGGALAIAATMTLIGTASDGRVRPVAVSEITGSRYAVNATEAELGATPPGSPGRAVVSWFHAIQTGDHQALKRLTNPSAWDHLSEHQIYQAAENIAGALGRPMIYSVRAHSGDVRAVRTLILSYGDLGVTSAEARTFNTTRSDGNWRVADASYIIDASEALTQREQRRSRPAGS